MRNQLIRVALSFASFAVFACGTGDVTLGNNEYSIMKTSSGGATGDGQHCSWAGGTTYNVGDTVPSQDTCNNCRCTAQGIACTTKVCAANDAGPGSCSYGGRDYPVGATFKSSDGCNDCSCSNGGAIACTERACAAACTFGGKVYKAGETWSDGCNGCACSATGQISCTAKACLVCVYNGTTYNVGDNYPAGDGCNTCSCLSDGTSACTTKPCAQP